MVLIFLFLIIINDLKKKVVYEMIMFNLLNLVGGVMVCLILMFVIYISNMLFYYLFLWFYVDIL